MNAVALDTSVLGLLVHPAPEGEPEACRTWLTALQEMGWPVLLSVVNDDELRRELIRISSRSSIRRLNFVKENSTLLPVTTRGMIRAAELWAQLRNQGTPTAHPKHLDADVILTAHVQRLARKHDLSIVVATSNVRHLALMVNARRWQDIAP